MRASALCSHAYDGTARMAVVSFNSGFFTCKLISLLLLVSSFHPYWHPIDEFTRSHQSSISRLSKLWILCGYEAFQVRVQRCQWSLFWCLERWRFSALRRGAICLLSLINPMGTQEVAEVRPLAGLPSSVSRSIESSLM